MLKAACSIELQVFNAQLCSLCPVQTRERHTTLKVSLNGVTIPWDTGEVKPVGSWNHTAYASGGATTGSNDNTWNNYPSRLEDTPMNGVVPIEFSLLHGGAGFQRVIGLRRGNNMLEVSLVDDGKRPVQPLTLAEVRLVVRYESRAHKVAARL